MDWIAILSEIESEVKMLSNEGAVASYIPELSKVNPDKLGIHIIRLNGEEYAIGNSNEKFSIQSISKVFALAYAMNLEKGKVWERVKVEPSGTPFNSLVQLEYEKGIPRNPFINPGAIVIADILVSRLKNPLEDYLDFVKKISKIQNITYNTQVANSEKTHGYRNAAHANLLKAFGNLHNPVEEVLDFYFHICALEMTCHELASAFMLFVDDGKIKGSNETILTRSQTKRLNALMQTCGFYDEAGEFAFRVGLPGKSGVGGGIVAIHPKEYSIAVWSPRLNKCGNSLMGMKALELLTTKTGLSIF